MLSDYCASELVLACMLIMMLIIIHSGAAELIQVSPFGNTAEEFGGVDLINPLVEKRMA